MLKNIRQLVTVLIAGIFLAIPVAIVGTAQAQLDPRGGVTCGAEGLPPGETDCRVDSQESAGNVSKAANDIVNLLSWVVGVVSVIMIIVGGFKYITSGGSSEKVTSAKNTIIYAVIGLVIVALAQFIVNFVIGKAVSVDS